MKLYLKVLLWFVFVIGNLYAVKFAFAGMTYESDLTYFLGLLGLVLLVVTDAAILLKVFKKYPPKGDLL